jgi:hypothetical protein
VSQFTKRDGPVRSSTDKLDLLVAFGVLSQLGTPSTLTNLLLGLIALDYATKVVEEQRETRRLRRIARKEAAD